jgi:SAM-dependent MidA family methyltransferase
LSLTLGEVSDEAVRVPARIRRAIEDRGPIPFSEFMELALYSPGGFYDRPPVGEGGHFVTSPHVHPLFAACLASAMRKMWQTMDRPDPFHVVEVGAGDGTMARQLLEELEDLPVEYVVVERSPGAREMLAKLPVTVAASLETVHEDLTGCIFANELLDNLPFERVRRTARGMVHVLVDVVDGVFVEVEAPCSDELARLARPILPGEEKAVSPAQLAMIDRVARVLGRGYAIFIDYGEEAGVQTYRSHRRGADVLVDPGASDITAGVDFDALVRRASDWGLQVNPPIPQGEMLTALGIAGRVEAERLQQVSALDQRRGREALQAWDARRRAALLVDPAGLGSLWWLWLSKGCGWWYGFPRV